MHYGIMEINPLGSLGVHELAVNQILRTGLWKVMKRLKAIPTRALNEREESQKV
jgi:hypothetical protein